MTINLEKTEAIIFTRKRIVYPPTIKVSGHSVQWSDSVKYLGTILDYRLRSGPAITYRVNKAFTVLKILYPFINKKSKLRTNLKLLLYKTCVRSTLLYAAPVWSTAANYQLLKVQRIQNKYLRIILDMPPETAISVLHREANLEYVDTYIKRMVNRAYRPQHTNPLIACLGDYDAGNLPFKKIKCHLPKEFSLS